jgi:WD40 repeat protein
VSVAMSKTRCPVFKLAWTPRGDRLITGNSIGEFSLWDNGTFSKTKEVSTINDGSSFAIRGMGWPHDGKWLVGLKMANYRSLEVAVCGPCSNEFGKKTVNLRCDNAYL